MIVTDAFTPEPVHRGLSFKVLHGVVHRNSATAWLREEGDRVYFDEYYFGDSIGDFKTQDLVNALEAVLNKEDSTVVFIDPSYHDGGPPTLHRDSQDGDRIVYTHSCGDRRFIHRETVQQLVDHLRSWLATPSS